MKLLYGYESENKKSIGVCQFHAFFKKTRLYYMVITYDLQVG